MKVKDVEIGLVVTLNSEPQTGMTVVKLYPRPAQTPAEWLVDMLWLDCELKPHVMVEIPVEAIALYARISS